MSSKIRANEISSIIKERIDNFELDPDINKKEENVMNKTKMLTSAYAGSLMAGDYLGDIMFNRNKKTASDIRCKEKKVAKRRAKNKNKKKGK